MFEIEMDHLGGNVTVKALSKPTADPNRSPISFLVPKDDQPPDPR
jgi:hypothetical protein